MFRVGSNRGVGFASAVDGRRSLGRSYTGDNSQHPGVWLVINKPGRGWGRWANLGFWKQVYNRIDDSS